MRNVGMHAGGVLIAPGKITDFCPLYMQPGSASAVSQFDKDDVEAIGLVKFDFLGLATLTILELAKDFIVARHPEQRDFDYDALPLDDAKVYALFTEGRTESVFQFESGGMRRMLKDAKPNRFEDLIALNAMFRPGPMENIPSFCNRKHGREEVRYPHPLLETVLGETYGIMVYQEQVMQAGQILGGYSLGGADLLRKAMGKKKPEEMATHRAIFRDGAAKKGIGAEVADEVFDLMEKFAGYGFNKAHATAYSLLAYQTAWIKVHFSAEFFAANMSVGNRQQRQAQGVAVRRPHLRRDGRDPRCQCRHLPFRADVRQHGSLRPRRDQGHRPGRDRGDRRCARIRRPVHEPVRLLRPRRSRQDQPPRRRGADQGRRFRQHPRRPLVAAGERRHRPRLGRDAGRARRPGRPVRRHVRRWRRATARARRCRRWSGRATGASRSGSRSRSRRSASTFPGHLFDQSAAEVRRFVKLKIADLIDTRETLLLAGIVGDLRVVNGQRGRVALFKLDDMSDSIEAVANEELLNANRELLKDDELVIVQGRAQPDRFTGGVRFNVQSVWDLAAARCRFGKYLRVEINGSVPPVAEVLRDFPSRRSQTEHGEIQEGLRVRLQLHRGAATGELDLGDAVRFYPSESALERWQTGAAHGRIAIVYE